MAITAKIEQETKKEISFPCLMKDIKSNLVVLFTSSQTGIVVSPGLSWRVGEYRTDWMYARDQKHWGASPPITLSNS